MSHKFIREVALLIRSIALLLLVTIIACSSANKGATNNEQFLDENLKTEKFVYTIGANDVLKISVFRHDDLQMDSVSVHSDGIITLPLLGDVQVEGLTVTELRDKLEGLYGKYVLEPQVIVSVTNAVSKKIFVLGEVVSPGTIRQTAEISLLEAILQSGGPTYDAKTSAVLLIRGKKAYKVNLNDSFNGKRFESISLASGDIVYLPSTTISSVSRALRHVSSILAPFVALETGIVLAPSVADVFKGEEASEDIAITTSTTSSQ